jgi:hypothetical protein
MALDSGIRRPLRDTRMRCIHQQAQYTPFVDGNLISMHGPNKIPLNFVVRGFAQIYSIGECLVANITHCVLKKRTTQHVTNH